MTVVAMSTLGTSPYTEVTYRFASGEAVKSSYPIHALMKRAGIKFDQTIVLLTDEARRQNWELLHLYLTEAKAAGVVRDISIKDGRKEDELWEIFQAITDAVPEKAELYIDITHGLRHLPMLLVMACAYLRVAKEVQIKSISYGAFELGDREVINGRSTVVACDVFDILPFVTLFDWANATSAFQRAGDASFLADLLRKTGTGLPTEGKAEVEKVAQRLDNVTLALDLARPDEAMIEAQILTQELNTSAQQVQRYAKPFGLLKGLIERTFQRISLPEARTNSVADRLRKQRDLIYWYMERGRVALASLIAREWFISDYMQKHRITPINDYESREGAGNLLSRRPDRNARPMDARWYRIWRELRLRDVRNEIAHAGQSEDQPMTAAEIKKTVEEIVKEIKQM